MDRLIGLTFEAFYPRAAGLPGYGDLDSRDYVRKLRKESGTLFWLGILSGTALFHASPLITVGWPVPAFLLPREVLDRHAHRLTTHPLYLVRQSTLILKMGAAFHWAAHPEVRRKWGLPPYAADPGTFRTSSGESP